MDSSKQIRDGSNHPPIHDECMVNGWIDGWMDRKPTSIFHIPDCVPAVLSTFRTDGRTDGRMDGWMFFKVNSEN